MNNTIAELLKNLAPTVASAFLGPMGGIAVTAIGKIFGIDSADTVAISKQFTEGKITSDQLAAIKKLELQYQNDEAERGFKYSELEFKDSDSARQMQITTQSAVPAAMSFLITAGFFGILAWMMYTDNVKDSPPLLIMLGALGAEFSAVCKFWFGSTRESANKNKMLANSTPNR